MSFGKASAWVGAMIVVLGATGAVSAVEILPHRAIYDLSMSHAKSGSGIVDARGSMLLEWADACEGWTIDQRYRLTIVYDEGGESDIAVSFATWESKNGKSYRFFVRKLRDGDVTDEVRGRAEIDRQTGGEAKFTLPEDESIALPPGTSLPSDHTVALIEAARRGERFLSLKVFDGSEFEGPSEVAAAIGSPLPPELPSGAKPNQAADLKRPSWWTRLAYYRPGSEGSEPDYEIGMRLFDNGVADGLLLDYGDLIVRATMKQIEALPKSGC